MSNVSPISRLYTAITPEGTWALYNGAHDLLRTGLATPECVREVAQWCLDNPSFMEVV